MAAQKAGVPVTLVDNSQASLDKGLKFAGNDEPPYGPKIRAVLNNTSSPYR